MAPTRNKESLERKRTKLRYSSSFYCSTKLMMIIMVLKLKDLYVEPATKIETGCCRPCLPLDVVRDILSRLPANSIARFRCVCRQWLSLTSDPRFLKLQHERSSSCMLISRIVYKGEVNLFEFRNGYRSSHGFNLGRAHYELSNFVDGLICAYSRTARYDTYILNPMIRELQKLPKNSDRQEDGLNESFGLGIDVAIRRYKVVRLCSYPGSNRVRCEIYNVGTTRWKSLGEAPFGFGGTKPVFLHGALHWIVYESRADFGWRRKEYVLRIDIKDEKFGSAISIPSPTCPKMSLVCLKESGGKLWLVFSKYENPNDSFF
ncbi:F-box/kelch-repeat protein At3g23880-like [Asparagus officinalis]|uniref:F-box/kelch-repeat protein At3g23880-like n=1 Tax=Asparagus officinalis TaxID=4686 RepID=UPI00098E39B7|nr:F-box/kelch-repeat protein At3g23880-like [Asparagus officinalis]